jgi:hypothetical protein
VLQGIYCYILSLQQYFPRQDKYIAKVIVIRSLNPADRVPGFLVNKEYFIAHEQDAVSPLFNARNTFCGSFIEYGNIGCIGESRNILQITEATFTGYIYPVLGGNMNIVNRTLS